MSADRYNYNKSWEHIQNKYVGTGHADITKFEWAVNQHRDTIASYIGHPDMMMYFSVAQNDSIGRTRFQLLEVGFIFYLRIITSLKYLIILFFLRKCYNLADLLLLKKMILWKTNLFYFSTL